MMIGDTLARESFSSTMGMDAIVASADRSLLLAFGRIRDWQLTAIGSDRANRLSQEIQTHLCMPRTLELTVALIT